MHDKVQIYPVSLANHDTTENRDVHNPTQQQRDTGNRVALLALMLGLLIETIMVLHIDKVRNSYGEATTTYIHIKILEDRCTT